MRKVELVNVVRLTPCVSMIEAWEDDTYIVQVNHVYDSKVCDFRFSVRRKDFKDGITWDEIERIKSEIGKDGFWGVELYPPDEDIMNHMNIRHIFLMNVRPDFAFVTNCAKTMSKQVGWEKKDG